MLSPWSAVVLRLAERIDLRLTERVRPRLAERCRHHKRRIQAARLLLVRELRGNGLLRVKTEEKERMNEGRNEGTSKR